MEKLAYSVTDLVKLIGINRAYAQELMRNRKYNAFRRDTKLNRGKWYMPVEGLKRIQEDLRGK